jgi:hypothetical protein
MIDDQDCTGRDSLPWGFRTVGYPGLYLAVILAMLVTGPRIALAFALVIGLAFG